MGECRPSEVIGCSGLDIGWRGDGSEVLGAEVEGIELCKGFYQQTVTLSRSLWMYIGIAYPVV